MVSASNLSEQSANTTVSIRTDSEAADFVSETVGAYVRMSVKSGIDPLSLRYCPIYHPYRKIPIAYNTSPVVNSIMMGTLDEEQYATTAAYSDAGIKLAEWSIRRAARDLHAFAAAGRNVEFISVPVPSVMVSRCDLAYYVGSVLDEERVRTPEKLCIRFPGTLLLENKKAARTALLDLKLLKVKTLMTDCAAENCPMARLYDIPVDMVTLGPQITAMIDDRDRPQTLPALLSYLSAMGVAAICDGADDDTQLNKLYHAGAIGYMPSDVYHGAGPKTRRDLTVDEAVEQQEG